MTVKDGIVFGIGFTIGKILVTGLTNIGVDFAYPKLYRKMKEVNPDYARYMNRVRPCEKLDSESHAKSKAKIGFEI